jgi:hypothetical protein
MSKQPRISLTELIANDITPPADVPPMPVSAPVAPAPVEVVPVAAMVAPRVAEEGAPRAIAGRSTTLRSRSKQVSLYLEMPVYDELRNIAHVERVKMHQLLIEGLDLLFKRRGHPPIKELMKRTKAS